MQLIYYPSPNLMEVCDKTSPSPGQDRLIISKAMWKIMINSGGIGLAASQVGLRIRTFVWKENDKLLSIWNPRLSCLSGFESTKEGCLSLPKISVTMTRQTTAFLDGENIDGLPIHFLGNSLTTRIWQHEIDHLDGKLIIDNMNNNETISNSKALKKLMKNAVS